METGVKPDQNGRGRKRRWPADARVRPKNPSPLISLPEGPRHRLMV